MFIILRMITILFSGVNVSNKFFLHLRLFRHAMIDEKANLKSIILVRKIVITFFFILWITVPILNVIFTTFRLM